VYNSKTEEAARNEENMLKSLKKFNFLKLFLRCLNGEATLFQAFWIVYVLFGCIQFILLQFIFQHYLSGSYVYLNVNNELTDKFITFAFPYLFFSSLCVWSCGKNSWIEWNISSKVIVAIPVLVGSFHLTNVF
jgi:hypothetical protein